MIGRALGFQYLIDLQGCNPSRIANSSFVRDVLLSAAREAGATIVTDIFHQFNPYGVSGVVVIAESHVAIHTWPEHGFASIDFFSCSDKVNANRLLAKLAEDLQASGSTMQLIERGKISAQSRVEVVGFE